LYLPTTYEYFLVSLQVFLQLMCFFLRMMDWKINTKYNEIKTETKTVTIETISFNFSVNTEIL